MSAQKSVAIHQVNVEMFLCISANFASSCCKIRSQGKTKVIRLHPLETMNVCTKFHCNPSNSCWAILALVDQLTEEISWMVTLSQAIWRIKCTAWPVISLFFSHFLFYQLTYMYGHTCIGNCCRTEAIMCRGCSVLWFERWRGFIRQRWSITEILQV